MLQQYACLEERYGSERAIVLFSEDGSLVSERDANSQSSLRGDFQKVCTKEEMNAAIAEIQQAGPIDGNRTGVLTDVEIPVPSGPVDKW
jgi:tRNA-dihydrouridine synthase B